MSLGALPACSSANRGVVQLGAVRIVAGFSLDSPPRPRSRPEYARQSAIRLNHPQAAMRKMQNRIRRSNLELRGPRNGLKMGPRSSRG
eukprot:4722422-Alexandrium_andersonii.AAC.1